jgi:hypothetical protein
MLGLRYWIARGRPPAGVTPAIQADDYWVIVDQTALPRAFVPREVRVVSDDRQRLALLARADFDPSAVAYVESALTQPPPPGPIVGRTAISAESPCRIEIHAEMKRAGLLVLADRWDSGWVARVGGVRTPILRVNHALRGVELPAGRSTVEFSYEPAAFRIGLILAAIGMVGCVAWVAVGVRPGARVR